VATRNNVPRRQRAAAREAEAWSATRSIARSSRCGSSDKEIRASRGSGIASPGLRFLELSTSQRFVEVYFRQ